MRISTFRIVGFIWFCLAFTSIMSGQSGIEKSKVKSDKWLILETSLGSYKGRDNATYAMGGIGLSQRIYVSSTSDERTHFGIQIPLRFYFGNEKNLSVPTDATAASILLRMDTQLGKQQDKWYLFGCAGPEIWAVYPANYRLFYLAQMETGVRKLNTRSFIRDFELGFNVNYNFTRQLETSNFV